MGCTVIVVVLLFLFLGLMLASMFSGKYTAFEDATKWFFFFVVPLLFALKFAIREDKAEHEKRRQEAERELERQRLELAELERRRWEQTAEGKTFLEQQRREAEEKERIEAERRKREAEEQEKQAERTARNNWRKWHEAKTLSEIAEMTGLEFEEFLHCLLTRMGFTNLQLTPINDQGGDLVGESPDGVRTVVQAKRWKSTLGNAVVQELLGAMLHYDAAAGMVITNSAFTPSARQLAAKDQRITLCDGSWLDSQIRKFLSPEIPEFDWDIYNARIAAGRSPKPRRKGESREERRRKTEILAKVASGEITPEEAGRLLMEGRAK